MMNDNAKLWVKELRGVIYQQGEPYLRRWEKFSCLGVACDLYVRYNNDLKVSVDSDGVYHYWVKIYELPYHVVNWLNIRDCRGKASKKILGEEECNFSYGQLATLNHIYKYDFNQIADIIEDNIQWYFKD